MFFVSIFPPTEFHQTCQYIGMYSLNNYSSTLKVHLRTTVHLNHLVCSSNSSILGSKAALVSLDPWEQDQGRGKTQCVFNKVPK